MTKKISLTIDPYILFHSDFNEIKKEKEAELIQYHKEGHKVRLEVQYPKMPPQKYRCEFPKNGEVKWENCTFIDITDPYVKEHI